VSGALQGRTFYKMSGSGNDFVIFDERESPTAALRDPSIIQRVCERRTGIGADGIVLLEPSASAAFRMIYFNSDGSRAALCGNAALCSVRLAVDLGFAAPSGLTFETDSGVLSGRMRDGLPEFDLPAVTDVRPSVPIEPHGGERRVGFALAGVPHLVVLCGDVGQVDVQSRGRELRRDRLLPDGANVNFVAPRAGGWAMRTYERGVEGETLACGTGAVATALVLRTWPDGSSEGSSTRIDTSSGQPLFVRVVRDGAMWQPSLRGEGRIVCRGSVCELSPAA
jgi:diaminopimelate epimerase